ncbi:FAD-dependent oxidoreductase [Acidovorax sp.]|uniref:NAD(P)/FAD-dependent oxidoreductase n=1 Tax=Acidovorax sp. TaxID=1872122 RepID=UPI00258B8754|nr:FAD-dependent oxidoreductase [Acidovorax sp.]
MTSPVSRPAKRPRRPGTQASAPAQRPSGKAAKAAKAPRHFAIIGAGMAGVACARTLVQAGHQVTIFEKSPRAGGRTTTIDSPFGSFDAGAQYFTVRDPRFAKAIETVPGLCRPWSANAVRVLDAAGRVAAAGLPTREPHWVASPGMNALVTTWAAPLLQAGQLITDTRVSSIERDPLNNAHWQLRTEGSGGAQHVYAGFDAVLLAQPATPAQALLAASALDTPLTAALSSVHTAPCWTLMLAYPQAVRPGLTTLGPQWNAARSTHHRIAWLARESSKPGRTTIERWTVQASPAWSAEHLEDDVERVQSKLLKAFAEVTGIRAQPAHADTRRWRYAQTTQPLGQSHLWDASLALGACGDWCLGHRLEDAFVSGLELALAVA